MRIAGTIFLLLGIGAVIAAIILGFNAMTHWGKGEMGTVAAVLGLAFWVLPCLIVAAVSLLLGLALRARANRAGMPDLPPVPGKVPEQPRWSVFRIGVVLAICGVIYGLWKNISAVTRIFGSGWTSNELTVTFLALDALAMAIPGLIVMLIGALMGRARPAED